MVKFSSGDPISDAWRYLAVGRLVHAEAAILQAEALCADEVEVLCLRGALCSAQEDLDSAFAHLEHAQRLDPQSPAPLLQAAELELHERGNPSRAIQLLTCAEKIAKTDEHRADVLLLSAEVALYREDLKTARTQLRHLSNLTIGDFMLLTRAGQIYYALEEDGLAEAAFLAALALEPTCGDASHGLGLVYEARGTRASMIEAWLTAHRLDSAVAAPDWHLSETEFYELVEAVIRRLPASVCSFLRDVPIEIAEAPSRRLVEQGFDPRALCMFVEKRNRSSLKSFAPELESVRIFHRNFERIAQGPEDLAEQIRQTLLQESSHFFGQYALRSAMC